MGIDSKQEVHVTFAEVEDEIYPLHCIDQSGNLRWMISWVHRFNDVLDAEKLQTSLTQLLKTGSWKKLGGRLRLKKDGQLEIVVPPLLTTRHPPFTFTHDTTFASTSIEDHPEGRHIAKPTPHASTQPIPERTRHFQGPPGGPETIEELCKSDKPMVSVHVTSFDDATLVGITWPHCLMDAVGQKDLLRNWSLVLAGKSDEVVPVWGARYDVLEDLETIDMEKTNPRFSLGARALSGFSLMSFYIRHLWYIFTSGAPKLRLIYLPKAIYRTILGEARQDIAYLAQTYGESLFISDADILVSWFVKIMASSEKAPKPITAATTFNPRFCLPELRNTNGTYVQNMTLLQCTDISKDLAGEPLGLIALRHRQCIREHAAEGQTRAYLRAIRSHRRDGKDLIPLVGDPRSRGLFLNDLTRIEILQAADFAPAVVYRGEAAETRLNPAGTMVSYFCRNMAPKDRKDPYFAVYGKDHGEGLWMLGNGSPKVWAAVEQELRRLEEKVSLSEQFLARMSFQSI